MNSFMNLGQILLQVVIFHSKLWQRKKNKGEGIFLEWPLKLFLFGKIFENDQIGGFSYLVIIIVLKRYFSENFTLGIKEISVLSWLCICVKHHDNSPVYVVSMHLKKRLKIKSLFEILHNTVSPPVVSLSPISESIFHSLFRSGQWRKTTCCVQS